MNIGSRCILLAVMLVIGVVFAGAVDAQSVMQAGGWKKQMRIFAKESETGNYVMINEFTSTVCLSPAFLADNPYLTPRIDWKKMEQKQAQCTISDIRKEASSASWKITCATPDNSLVEASIRNTVSSTTITSQKESIIKKEGEVNFVKTLMEGSFVGKCTDEMLQR